MAGVAVGPLDGLASAIVRARALGDGPDLTGVRTLKQVRALASSRIPESVSDLMTRS
jgi:hypothetical protein